MEIKHASHLKCEPFYFGSEKGCVLRFMFEDDEVVNIAMPDDQLHEAMEELAEKSKYLDNLES